MGQVELIGDCYFAATGGPAGDGAHADVAARLGIAMIAAVRDVAAVYGVELQVQTLLPSLSLDVPKSFNTRFSEFLADSLLLAA